MFLPLLLCATSCREDELVVPTEYTDVGGADGPLATLRGLYLVNEGNMGSNKCTLDYYDFATGVYSRNIYAERNPGVAMELGDVGNDAGVYGSKLYVVVNCSHKVEVLDASTGVRLGQVDIPNCRYLAFHGGHAYVSSYVGPVRVDPDAPKGAVFRVDTLSLSVTGRVTVGYQPEEMAVVGDSLYVANSGGYRAPDYDTTVSVVDLAAFRQVGLIDVGPNLGRCRADRRGRLWVASRGSAEAGIPPRLHLLEPDAAGRMTPARSFDIAVSDLAFRGDSLLYISSQWTATQGYAVGYGIVDTAALEPLAGNFITDGTEQEVTMPYGLAVNPESGDIYLTDAKNYVSSGTLHCFSPDGRRKWSVRTGDIPAHICFLPR